MFSLVDAVAPGARISVVAISSLFNSGARERLGAAAIRTPFLRVVGIEDAAGTGQRAASFTPEEEQKFREARRIYLLRMHRDGNHQSLLLLACSLRDNLMCTNGSSLRSHHRSPVTTLMISSARLHANSWAAHARHAGSGIASSAGSNDALLPS